MPDISSAEKELLIKKHEATMKLRNEFLKQVSNPYRQAQGGGGGVFDPALARFQAMRVNHYDHFKPTFKSFRVGLFTVALPIILFAWALKSERNGREHLYRTGQVAYKDRKFKFI